jgi:hypothetical protein
MLSSPAYEKGLPLDTPVGFADTHFSAVFV